MSSFLNNPNNQFLPNTSKKSPVKFKIPLNEEQKLAKATALESVITVFKGKAGSGKSLLAANIALDLLFRKAIEKIIITRPTVISGDDIGFLPGDMNDKLAPFTAPVYENMHRLHNKEKIEKCIQTGQIEILPVAFMRGRNFTDCLVIVDEAQNLTQKQTELILTRLCHGSRIILCGDADQTDLRNKKDSGFPFLTKYMNDVEGFNIVELKTNHRHSIVTDILNIYEKFRD